MKVIDTHCHLEEDVFQEDLDNVVNKAMSKGIQIITSAINSNSWGRGQQIADQYENVHLSLGLDPTQYSSYSEALDKIRENKDRIVAVGEIGLDHYRVRDHSERELQAYAFRELALFAIASKLPVQIHSRSAGKAALEVLYGLDIGLVHMHAFDGKSSYARTASQEYGYYFSIPTSVVRSPQKKKLVKAVDIERLLVETDSPVLGPTKGVRNEPSNILVAVKEIAKILAMEEEEIRNILLENTLRLYPNLTNIK